MMDDFVWRSLRDAVVGFIVLLFSLSFIISPEDFVDEKFAMNLAATLMAIAIYCIMKGFVRLVLDSIKIKKSTNSK